MGNDDDETTSSDIPSIVVSKLAASVTTTSAAATTTTTTTTILVEGNDKGMSHTTTKVSTTATTATTTTTTSAPENDNDNDNNEYSDHSSTTPIVLPNDYQLVSWRVSNGSVVHIGETIAIIAISTNSSCSSSSSTTTNDDDDGISTTKEIINDNGKQKQQQEQHIKQTVSSNNIHYKRPTRRKRPITNIETEEIHKKNDNEVNVPTIAAAATRTTISKTDTISSSSSSSSSPTTATNIKSLSLSTTTTRELLPVSPLLSTTSSSSSSSTIVATMDGILRIRSTSRTENEDRIIGYIDPCSHPTIISGLCAVCGTIVTNFSTNNPLLLNPNSTFITNTNNNNTNTNNSTSNQSNQNMTIMTVSGMTVTISDSESKRMAIQDTKRLQEHHKLSLVLDLDHTLLHATADPRADKQCSRRTDVRRLILPFIYIDNNNNNNQQQHQQQQPQVYQQQHFVKLRPYVKEFLQNAMVMYEIGVYTAGTRDYAEQITILLSRHLVDAKRDQMDLERLRNNVYQLEQKYHYQQQQQQQQQEEVKNDDQIASNDVKSNDNEIGLDGKDSSDDNKSKASEGTSNGLKRKRVHFDVTTTSIPPKADTITLNQIQQARDAMQEAEEYEKRAQELRRKIFGSRVMSRTESGESGRYIKSLKRIFPCGGSMAAVIDDREDVWANTVEDLNSPSTRIGEPPENLLLVRPYHWTLFHGYADINNTSGIDYSQTDNSSQAETDNQLLWTSDVLKTLHDRYYNKYNDSNRRTVPQILQEMRSEVLKGCVIVLSGLVPLSKQQQQSSTDRNQPRPNFVRYAEMLGATVQTNITEHVTHVVAAMDGTDKIILARKTIKGCYIVKPSWLVECLWSLTRRDEKAHLLGGTNSMTKSFSSVVDDDVLKFLDTKPTTSTNTVKSNDNRATGKDEMIDDNVDDEDFDDDFATELENEMSVDPYDDEDDDDENENHMNYE